MRSDEEFTNLALHLRTLHHGAEALSRSIRESLEAVRKTVAESHIAGQSGLTTTALRDLHDGLLEAQNDVAHLRTLAGDMRQLQRHAESLEKAGRFVNSSAFGFAIESSRTSRCEHTFGAFVGELRSLAMRISELARELQIRTGALSTAHEQQCRTLTNDHAQLLQLADQLEKTVDLAATALGQFLGLALTGLKRADEAMTGISQNSKEAVYFLQFGDIIRQKSDHIAQALIAVTSPSLAIKSNEVEIDAIIGIQMGQLVAIRDEVVIARKSIETSFNRVAHGIQQLARIVTESEAMWSETGGVAAPIESFKGNLHNLERLHEQGHSLRTKARKTAKEAGDVCQCLEKHVREVKAINDEMHLQALNAIVKAAALGTEGATLCVLSRHMDDVYRESREIVVRIVEVIGAVLRSTANPEQQKDLAEEAARAARIHAEMEKIDSIWRALRSTLPEVSKLIEAQQEALHSSRTKIAFLGEYVAIIDRQIEQLSSIRKELGCSGTSECAAPAFTEKLSSRYTMESEREIHRRAASAVKHRSSVEIADRLAAQAGNTPRVGSTISVEDNIEFF